MSIYSKLFEAKKEIGKISKDSKNPFFKSKYFDVNKLLDSVEPILQKNGLLLLQPIEDGKVFTKIIDVETSESVSSEMTLPNIQDPQKLGSAITYYRRYTLQSLLGLQAEDDDGNLAAKKPIVVTPTERLNKCKTLVELATVYESLSRTEKEFTLNLKDKLKTTLK
jgi:hypothetical protein